MTDPGTADAVYIEPINWQTVERIIAKERPDAILPTMGGQTALNCALDLAKNGVLEKYKVELIGATEDAIEPIVPMSDPTRPAILENSSGTFFAALAVPARPAMVMPRFPPMLRRVPERLADACFT